MTDVGRSVSEAMLHNLLERMRRSAGVRFTEFDVFVSYASGDRAVADRLCDFLEANGKRCWIAPRDIAPGEHYAEIIDATLKRTRTLVILLTKASTSSSHVLRELERAVHYGLRVCPIRLDLIEPSGALGYLLSGTQWIDAFGNSATLESASRRVSTLC